MMMPTMKGATMTTIVRPAIERCTGLNPTFLPRQGQVSASLYQAPVRYHLLALARRWQQLLFIEQNSALLVSLVRL